MRIAVGARLVWSDDFGGAGIKRDSGAGVRGGSLFAHFHFRDDFVGGLVRWLVDRRRRHELRDQNLDEDQLVAEGDKSPGVLLASGILEAGQ